MAHAHEGTIKICSEDFPAFMWPYGTEYCEGFMSNGLCLGEILIDVRCALIFGT